MFLYSTVSTLKPMVGMVTTDSPSFILYSTVVLPAASAENDKGGMKNNDGESEKEEEENGERAIPRPTMMMRTAFLESPISRRILEKKLPMIKFRTRSLCKIETNLECLDGPNLFINGVSRQKIGTWNTLISVG